MNFIKGILIGVALVVPGLSGSIFAVVVGLYDKILFSINDFKKDPKSNIIFLLPIILGCAIGVVFSTKFVLWVCQKYTKNSYLFFTGLVLGSLPLVVRNMRLEKMSLKKISIAICSFLLIASISIYINPTGYGSSTNYVTIKSLSSISDFIIVLFSGMFSCSLMAIPGVSGSVMLMIINQYGTVYNSVSALSDVIKCIIAGNITEAINLTSTVFITIPFIIGAVIGIIIISKLLVYAISEYKSDTYYAVSGLVIGATVALLKEGVLPNIQPQSINSIILSLICITSGILCTNLLDRR